MRVSRLTDTDWELCVGAGLEGWRPVRPLQNLREVSTASPLQKTLQSISASPPSHNGWSSPAQAVRTDLELKPYHSTRMRSLDTIGLSGVKLGGVRESTPPE